MKDNIINLVLLKMTQGYQEQIAIYEQMRLIALEQEKSLSGEEVNIELLLEQINLRQELIEVLDRHNNEIGRLRKEISDTLGIDSFSISVVKAIVPGSGVSNLEKVLGKLAALLAEIKELDRENENKLRRRIAANKERLSRIQSGKKANEAYGLKKAEKEGIFIDYSK